MKAPGDCIESKPIRFNVFHFTVQMHIPSPCTLSHWNRATRELDKLIARDLSATRFVQDISYEPVWTTVVENDDPILEVPIIVSIGSNESGIATHRLEQFLSWINEVSQHGYKDLSGATFQRHVKSDPIEYHNEIDPYLASVLYPHINDWIADDPLPSDQASHWEEAFKESLDEELSIRVGTLDNAVHSLEFSLIASQIVAQDTSYWKWVFISLHNALQGFMVDAVAGTSFENVQTDDGKLFDYLNLYKCIKSDQRMRHRIDSVKFVPIGSQGSSIKRLNHLRNEFTHFTDKTWIITPESVGEFPQILEDVTSTIEFLAFRSKNVRWYRDNGELEERTKSVIAELHQAAEAIAQSYYEKACRHMPKEVARRYFLLSSIAKKRRQCVC